MDKTTILEKMGWQLENSYAELPAIFYTNTKPVPVHSPESVLINYDLANSLGMNPDLLMSSSGAGILAGNDIPPGSYPIAQAYAGHQFGHFTILGDGRAILLGEQNTPLGQKVDIQLKGSGRTPYSRGGDGRATLGPMLREYIISEGMFALGIPTTRSLAVVTTGEEVMRDTALPGAVLTRVAASHIRVGTFQFALVKGSVDELKSLADYTIKRHFPESMDKDNPYRSLLRQVVERQAALISKWQLVGFIHGVMNTDNMALGGETIDYGPCAFMDNYDPATVFSSIDHGGRYAYGNQPSIATWNLSRFAETLLSLLDENEGRAIAIAKEEVMKFFDIFQENWLRGMRSKLGIFNREPDDELLIKELLEMMQHTEADYTNTFLSLTFQDFKNSPLLKATNFKKWHERWMHRRNRQNESESEVYGLMRSSNPALIPRNHKVEEALSAAVNEGDFGPAKRLLDALSEPFAHLPKHAHYADPPGPSSRPYRTFCGT
ncbi:MAG TPA: YdiU family protein [Anaerovoracaceae bacterium]|nr:YdiU family protein [Anaerovoracaceae bacterium]